MTAQHTDPRLRVRHAVADDVDELVRLRRLMFVEEGTSTGLWTVHARRWFQHTLAVREDWVCVVAGGDPGEQLVACGTAWITSNLPGPDWPDGYKGYIAGMCTDTAARQRGHARSVLAELLLWLSTRDVGVVELCSSTQGAPLYRDFGFVDHPLMRLHLRARPNT
jgi:ribosomal protein S18 acetylase RimI-like enzyme